MRATAACSNKLCDTYEWFTFLTYRQAWDCSMQRWVMSHVWMSHVSHVHMWDTLQHAAMSYVTRMNESCLSRTYVGYTAACSNELCHTYEWVISHTYRHGSDCSMQQRRALLVVVCIRWFPCRTTQSCEIRLVHVLYDSFTWDMTHSCPPRPILPSKLPCALVQTIPYNIDARHVVMHEAQANKVCMLYR